MKPIIAIPMGDPAGVGPEIVVKALADPVIAECAACLVVGDGDVCVSLLLHIASRYSATVIFSRYRTCICIASGSSSNVHFLIIIVISSLYSGQRECYTTHIP